ncbi:MAG: flagellin [Mobilicoccus sp.]|nr:flagellin [Mobilicoccus sp.]
MRIGTNIAAMSAYRFLGATTSDIGRAFERLSSGLRINRAADDAAGLAISERMRSQVNGMRQASRNAQDGISLVQTAEGALNETHAMLQRMRTLAVQAANGTLTDSNRAALQKEVDALIEQIDLGARTTQFNGMPLLDGTFADKRLQIGAGAGHTMSLSLGAATAAALRLAPDPDAVDGEVEVNGGAVKQPDLTVPKRLPVRTPFNEKAPGKAWDDWSTLGEAASVVSHTGTPTSGTYTVDGDAGTVSRGGVVVGSISGDGKVVTFADGASVTFDNEVWFDNASASPTGRFTLTAVGPAAALSVATQEDATQSIRRLDTAIATVSGLRSGLGAVQNRLDHTIRNLGVSADNLAAAESRIRDADMARQVMALTRGQILQQASTAMLAQAHQSQRVVLSLLG